MPGVCWVEGCAGGSGAGFEDCFGEGDGGGCAGVVHKVMANLGCMSDGGKGLGIQEN